MSAKATMRTGDLNRLLKAAKAHGFTVEFADGKVRCVPLTESGGQTLPSVEQAESEWDKALGLQ